MICLAFSWGMKVAEIKPLARHSLKTDTTEYYLRHNKWGPHQNFSEKWGDNMQKVQWTPPVFKQAQEAHTELFRSTPAWEDEPQVKNKQRNTWGGKKLKDCCPKFCIK